MGFISEFREFIKKGNVIDLAVAVLIGSAFQKIVDSIVNDIIMPIIAFIGNFKNIEALAAGPFTYGKLIASVLNFVIISAVLFIMVKAINRTKEVIIKDKE
ncbi:MAG: large conductance mechanosensitive channel protein MscL [Sphingomonadales bacterium]|jgi:large conductance mechanosensitive channel